MKKPIFWFALFLLLVTAATVHAATTVTWVPGQKVKVMATTWKSDASGDYTESIGRIDGQIIAVVTDPSEETGLVPDDNYTVQYIDDTTSYSLLGTQLTTNRDTANTEMLIPSATVYNYVGTTSIHVHASGNVTAGIIYTYVMVP